MRKRLGTPTATDFTRQPLAPRYPSGVLRVALSAFAAFFVTIGPLDTAAVFAALTQGHARVYQRRMAVRATLVAAAVLFAFGLIGDDVLRFMGISLAGVRVGGGILLMLVSIDIALGRGSAAVPSSDPADPETGPDVSVFPLAMPLIAGPGAITAVIVHATEAQNEWLPTAVVLAILALVLLLTLLSLLGAASLQRRLGETGMNVITRVLGVLLTALSAELILRGLRDSGVFRPG